MAIEDATRKMMALAGATAQLNAQLTQTVALSGAIVPPSIQSPAQFRPLNVPPSAPGPTINRGAGLPPERFSSSGGGGRGGGSTSNRELGREIGRAMAEYFKSSSSGGGGGGGFGLAVRTGASR